MEKIYNFIGGKHIAPGNGFLDVFEPATGTVLAQVASSSKNDIDLAVAAADKAAKEWTSLTDDSRARFLFQIADLIERDCEEYAEAESHDTGKPLSLTRKVDIPRAIANFRFFASAVTQFCSESSTLGSSYLNYTLRDPLGVVGCISPWNLPLYLLSWKIAPALATGNCVIAKPSEITPLTANLLSKTVSEAGLPAGVLNIVHGSGPSAGAALVSHPGVKGISFTGGSTTGRAISQAVSPEFKKLSLELGGKNANLIFADCDFDRTVETSVQAAFLNQGQICLCGSRILVEETIYKRFKDAFLEKVKALKVGDPLTKDTTQGAVSSRAHFEKILSAIEQAKQDGGRILCGGEPASIGGRCCNGWFIEPTVIEGVDLRCALNQEEIFGPVVSLMPFKDEGHAIDLANSTRYGLSASVWTQNLDRAHRVSRKLDAGIVWVNCWLVRDLRTPFGGMKDSGVGREGGVEALRFFTEPKNVCIHLSSA